MIKNLLSERVGLKQERGDIWLCSAEVRAALPGLLEETDKTNRQLQSTKRLRALAHLSLQPVSDRGMTEMGQKLSITTG